MIEDKDIIVFSDDWGRFPSTVQHIIKYFLPSNKVYWIGSLGLRKPKFSIKDAKRVYQKLFSFFRTNKSFSLPHNLTYHSFFVLPFHDFKIIRAINTFLLKRQVKDILQKTSSENLIVFTSNPIISNLIKSIQPACSIYFCLDDYTKFNDAFNYISIGEKELLRIVDLTYCVSKPLLKTRIPNKGEAFHLNQGIHLNHFHRISKIKDSGHQKDKVKHVVGFFGLIAEWVNIELIIKCANKYKNYEFELIGPHSIDISSFEKIDNIKYLGEKSFSDLPNFAKNFDVGIIPFRLNDLTMAVNPLKLIEYFSMGIPVVSVNIPEVEKFGDLVYLSSNDEEFIINIQLAVEENDDDKNNKRFDMANKYSWESIANDISTQIIDKLSNR